MSRLLTPGGSLSLPYRMSSTNNSFERLEMSLGGKIALRPLRSSRRGEFESFKKYFRHKGVYSSCKIIMAHMLTFYPVEQHVKQVDRYKFHLCVYERLSDVFTNPSNCRVIKTRHQ